MPLLHDLSDLFVEQAIPLFYFGVALFDQTMFAAALCISRELAVGDRRKGSSFGQFGYIIG